MSSRLPELTRSCNSGNPVNSGSTPGHVSAAQSMWAKINRSYRSWIGGFTRTRGREIKPVSRTRTYGPADSTPATPGRAAIRALTSDNASRSWSRSGLDNSGSTPEQLRDPR